MYWPRSKKVIQQNIYFPTKTNVQYFLLTLNKTEVDQEIYIEFKKIYSVFIQYLDNMFMNYSQVAIVQAPEFKKM